MTVQTFDAPARWPHGITAPRGSLALAFQEVFTVAIRVRARRQTAPDGDSFRGHVKQLLAAADRDARQLGYDAESVKLAVYALIALIDESVLNSNQPMFAAWPRQSLQEEVFGDHIAGENFFVHLQELLGRQDSEELADLLEVFELCILLGFRGRYALGHAGLDSVLGAVQQKIARIRGGRAPLSPSAALPAEEVIPESRDPWLRRLTWVMGGSIGVTVASFVIYWLLLRGGISEIELLTSQLIR
ncbi:MAG TPA: type IVB secretion system protein IcmH/DotU [Longimicrobiaceae bacterium]|nr:type IVB secretion system protein IcmH/DotU [Longimicrobiaceae bacterium]